MATIKVIRQLHYTSVRDGPGGHSGFQFSARSDDIDDAILRTVERLTVYEMPRDIDADADPSSYPVNLVYTPLGSLGQVVIARVTYAGRDFSNRPGNYFAHALILDDVGRDLDGSAPASMWDAPIWRDQPGSSDRLPVLPGPLSGGACSAGSIDDALGAASGATATLARLITAVEVAMGNGPRVVLVGASSVMVWQWIAAMSYVAGPVVSPGISFCTYARNPLRGSTHIVGTTAAGGALAATADSVTVIDPLARSVGDSEASPFGALMARAGVRAADEAWKIAVRLWRADVTRLSAWYPVLACALMAMGHELPADDLDAAVEWLAGEQRDPNYRYPIDEVAKHQRLGSLSPARQAQLVEIGFASARDQRDAAAEASLIEQAIAADSLQRFMSSLPADITAMGTKTGVEAARLRCVAALPQLDVKRRLGLIRWAAQAGALPESDIVRGVGRDAAEAILLGQLDAAHVSEAAGLSPDLRAGIVHCARGLPDVTSTRLLGALPEGTLQLADFRDDVRLGEKWLAARTDVASATPVEHFIGICKLRMLAGYAQVADPALIGRFWPDRPATVPELGAIAHALPPTELAASALSDLLVQVVFDTTALNADFDSWLAVTESVAAWPVELQGAHQVSFASTISNCAASVRRALDGSLSPESVLRALVAEYQHAIQRPSAPILERYFESAVFQLLFRHYRWPTATSILPFGLLYNASTSAVSRLKSNPHDLNLAAALFVARNYSHLDNRKKFLTAMIDDQLESGMKRWDRRELAAIDRLARDLDPSSKESFQGWTKKVKSYHNPFNRSRQRKKAGPPVETMWPTRRRRRRR
jgi:GTPase-associated protein 1, N-terminal domain type 2/GTPase-associated protein 1, middle domain